MKVGIVGSRGYAARYRVLAFVAQLAPGTTVLSGGARGVDSWAAEHALLCGLAVEEFLPDLKTHRVFALAAKARNKQIAEASDEVVAFWDGDSPGTANTIAWAVALGTPVRVVLP